MLWLIIVFTISTAITFLILKRRFVLKKVVLSTLSLLAGTTFGLLLFVNLILPSARWLSGVGFSYPPYDSSEKALGLGLITTFFALFTAVFSLYLFIYFFRKYLTDDYTVYLSKKVKLIIISVILVLVFLWIGYEAYIGSIL